ncbi:hypothetical protein OR1_03571 [Geobacter sp. OR-1]|uniref:DUF2844 domain-containing protein n=1 Tax=Geobacter sp. OR-1 TaxID=1266765 RepID=UPI000543D84D|nr:DUF2844 domain-containing protein [Geobacter sp. OR-1]GAM11260.1 hypothetical protein OR1_03571 [Geobacter sp. OR-1]
MKRYLPVLVLALGLVSVSLLAPRHAMATLGESVVSVEKDHRALAGVRGTVTDRIGYTVREIVADAYRVREYVAPAGIVFAVAWNGLAHPDLTTLLGSYAGKYRQAVKNSPRSKGRRDYRINTDTLVVEKWGHMRNLQGRAYDPALLPSGVSIDEIK